MSNFKNFHDYIRNNREDLALEIVGSVIQKMNLNISETEKQQALGMYNDLLGFFGESLIGNKEGEVPGTLLDWSKKNAEMQVASGGNISNIIIRYGPTREVLNDLLTRISIKLKLSLTENAFLIKLINSMLDISINETVYAFERLSDEFKAETRKELVQLSAPIVPVKEEIVVLPLIGYIDSERANYIMDYVIPRIAEMDISHVILDFSGVLTLNMEVSESLHQVGSTLRLMGIEVVITGLRPKLAQVAIQGSIDLSSLKSFATVKQALETIQ